MAIVPNLGFGIADGVSLVSGCRRLDMDFATGERADLPVALVRGGAEQARTGWVE